MHYYLGVDWADQTHAVWVVDEGGTKITARTVPHTAEGLSEWGRELDEWRAQGLELWAAIERPEGRVVDFLLDHGVVVYPVNPKALDRARDRFRQGGAKSDPFDARVLADFLRTDHPRLRALQPSSDAAQELKLLTEDCQRQIRQQTRLVNQLTATLKAEEGGAFFARRRGAVVGEGRYGDGRDGGRKIPWTKPLTAGAYALWVLNGGWRPQAGARGATRGPRGWSAGGREVVEGRRRGPRALRRLAAGPSGRGKAQTAAVRGWVEGRVEAGVEGHRVVHEVLGIMTPPGASTSTKSIRP